MKSTQELLEESRQETMAKLSKLVEEYYAKYQDAGEKQALTINHIEQFLLDCKYDFDKVLKEASNDIINSNFADEIIAPKNLNLAKYIKI